MDSHKIPVLGHFNAGRPPSSAHHHIKSFSAVQAAVIVRKVKADVVAVCLLVKIKAPCFIGSASFQILPVFMSWATSAV